MKESFVRIVLKVAHTWPFRVLASRMLVLRNMNRDAEALNAAIAAMRAATLATDAATAAVNAAAAATATRNLSSGAIKTACESIAEPEEPGFSWEASQHICPRRFNRTRGHFRSW